MKVMKMKIIFRKVILLKWINIAHCSISGISYMDPIKISSVTTKFPPGENPCNPLYWYPRNIPDYCYSGSTVKPATTEEPPISMPPAAPPAIVPILPPPIPILPPPMPILPPPMPILPPPVPILPPPLPILPPPPLIAGPLPLSLFPQPIPSNPYTYPLADPTSVYSPNVLSHHPTFHQPPATGFVPGIPGLVTKDGGINIMPFSDAYADMLEKHKNKIIRRKLHRILDKYENYPYSKSYRSLRKYEKYFTDE